MLTIRPYEKNDAVYLVRWLKNETTFRFWCTDQLENYPPTTEDIHRFYNGWKKDASFFFTACDEMGAPVGHITMRYLDDKNEELRFGFILVDFEKRGKGYGREMLTLGIRYAFDVLQVKKITIGVFENNAAASHLYEKLGFTPTGEVISYRFFGEAWKYLILEMENKA